MFLRILMILGTAFGAANLQAGIAVVVGKNVSATEAKKEDIANIFLGRTKALPDGTSLVPVDLDRDHPVRGEFYEKVTGQSVRAVVAAWAKIVFTGRGKAPAVKASASEVKAYVVSQNAIGYISSEEVDDSVKVLLTVP